MSEFWAWNPFSIGVKKHKSALGDTRKVLAEANRMRNSSPLATYDDVSFAGDVIRAALAGEDRANVYPSEAILSALMDMLTQTYHDEALSPVDERALTLRPNSREAVAIREYLRCQIRFLQNYTANMAQLTKHMASVSKYLMCSIPMSVLEGDALTSFLSTRFADLQPDLADTVDTIGTAAFDDDLQAMSLLDIQRTRFEANVMNVSKIDPRLPPANRHRYIMPKDSKGLSNDELVEQYLVGTPYRAFFNTELPLPINEDARFEHHHILGGTGHGKTQLIQKWISHDLEIAARERRSVVVIDSQGDMIGKIARLECFHPAYGALRDRLIIIDPTDVQYPAAINMFALNEERLASYGPVEREKVQNSAIALYEGFFSDLLGAELTAKQGVVFKYIARLMLEIPNATILTLRDLVDDPKPFIPYMDKLQGSARVFFAREFLDKSFNQTRKQISKRLWGVLSTPAFERLFSSTENKIDLFAELNSGKVILINTAKDLLKQDGTSLYGRFFLSLIGQAILERAAIPEEKRTPTFLYIDECQDYFDKTVELLLTQGRKYKTALTLANQHLDQFDTSGRSSVLANTSIKAAGGMNAKDARALASEMRVDADYLLSMQKTRWDSQFAFWMRNDLPEAISVTIPFGHLENEPRMSAHDFEDVLLENRARYCWRYVPQESALDVSFPTLTPKPAPVEPPPPPPDLPPPMLDEIDEIPSEPKQTGRGGKAHVQTQNLIKSLANQYGWKADLEYPVRGGAVDVWLERAGLSIACEITVSTPTEYEIRNIEKCRAAGADEIWVISENEGKLAEIESALSDTANVFFFTPDNLPAEIEARSDMDVADTGQVRGFTVAVKRAYVSESEREMRLSRLERLLKTHR
jgi:hypothetical protein